jgi:transposase
MSYLVCLPQIEGLDIVAVNEEKEGLLIIAQSRCREQACPDCGHLSRRVHSYYQRRPQDLPSQGLAVRYCLSAKRFRCVNPDCPRASFAERFPKLVAWHQHQTLRLNYVLEQLAFELGGEAGARCLAILAIRSSAATLLRRIRHCPIPIQPAPRIIGVDDWAFRRGVNYGSLIVDLESHQVVEVLPDRETATLQAWLENQPQIEIVSRDRAKPYMEAIDQGAPQAQQVADRWHLLKNLREVLNQYFQTYAKLLGRIGLEMPPPIPPIPNRFRLENTPKPVRPRTPIEELRLERRQHWEAVFQQVHELTEQGLSVSAIARELKLDRKTVRKYRRYHQLPKKTCTRLGPRIIDPFRAYIQERILSDNPSVRRLFHELREQGYRGGRSSVVQYTAHVRRQFQAPNQGDLRRIDPDTFVKPLTAPRLAAWVMLERAQRHPDQQRCIQEACDLEPQIAQAVIWAEEFTHGLRHREVDFLDPWIQKVMASKYLGLQPFALGLVHDYDAVRAAFTSPWSNAQLEGQITRLKFLKRQMYGRAKFDLLRLRVLHP